MPFPVLRLRESFPDNFLLTRKYSGQFRFFDLLSRKFSRRFRFFDFLTRKWARKSFVFSKIFKKFDGQVWFSFRGATWQKPQSFSLIPRKPSFSRQIANENLVILAVFHVHVFGNSSAESGDYVSYSQFASSIGCRSSRSCSHAILPGNGWVNAFVALHTLFLSANASVDSSGPSSPDLVGRAVVGSLAFHGVPRHCNCF